MLEVELKFLLDAPPAFRDQLARIGASETSVSTQADTYFNHPSRDFALTDEALRVRTVGGNSVVTYKGSKQGTLAKTRYELELPLAEATADDWGVLLIRLGFREVATVRKRRTSFRLAHGDRDFEITIDKVEGLGNYAEVETLADEATRDAAEQAVQALAAELRLGSPEPRSYLE
ncbi:MAG: class IV adenylate cyclase, partial [Planctomycetota bacterium]